MSLPFRLPRPALRMSADDNSLARETRLHPYLALLTRYWAVVLAATVLGALVGYGLSQLVTPTYSARSTLYFSIGFGTSGSDLNQGATYAQGQMLSFAELAESERVLKPVITELGLDQTVAELASQVEVTTPANTVVLKIAASSTDAALSASIANQIAQSLTGVVQEVAPRDADGKATVAVRTVQSADTPTSSVAPNTRVNVVAAALIGLVLSLLAIIAIRLLDTRLRGANGVAEGGGLPLLARLRASSATVFAADPESAAAEDYRRLAATIDAVEVEPSPASKKRARVFVLATVSSTLDAVDQSLTADVVGANLALAATEVGHRVALLSDTADANLAAGEEAAVTVHGIPSTRPLPAALLTAHDLVLITAPGAADGSRALRLSQRADGVILLADESHVHIGELRAAIDLLQTAGARIAGTVLTEQSTGENQAVSSHGRPVRWGLRRSLPAVLEHNEA